MYAQPFNAMHDEELHALVASAGSAELISVGRDGFPRATRLPIIWSGERLVFHMALANAHWRTIDPGAPVLVVVTGPEAYVSPSWYATKTAHGRVVPTWNYSAVHFSGRATVHRDAEWLRTAVTELTEQHESTREEPWQVTDAPASFVAQNLKAIVGIEVEITAIEAKAKRSQNRSDADRSGVIEGLQASPDRSGQELARQMRADLERD